MSDDAARFAHMTIHHPAPEHMDDVLHSMQRVAAAATGSPGLLRIGPWRDLRSSRIVGLALWESKEAFEAAMPAVFRSLPDDDPGGEWNEQPVEVFHLSRD